MPALLSLLLFLLLHLPPGAGRPNIAAPEPPLVLRATAGSFGPARFVVAAVRDEQPGRPPAARLLPLLPTAGSQPVAVGLRGGTAAAVQGFMAASLPAGGSGRYPVTLRILALQVREKPGPQAATATGTIALHLAFEWQNAAGHTITLTEYRGQARYGRSRPDRAVVEAALGQALLGGLRYFDEWLRTAAAHDVRLATTVRPTLAYDIRQTEPDTLFYDPARPLTWADFTGTAAPASHRYAAAVFPSFGYQARPRVRHGVLELDVSLKVFVVRSSSWVAAGQRTAYNLNHEQRHFDIARLVAGRFGRYASSPDSLTVADYQSELGWRYLDSFRELNRLQDAYDQQTHNGTDATAQQRWNQHLDAELRGLGVLKSSE